MRGELGVARRQNPIPEIAHTSRKGRVQFAGIEVALRCVQKYSCDSGWTRPGNGATRRSSRRLEKHQEQSAGYCCHVLDANGRWQRYNAHRPNSCADAPREKQGSVTPAEIADVLDTDELSVEFESQWSVGEESPDNRLNSVVVY